MSSETGQIIQIIPPADGDDFVKRTIPMSHGDFRLVHIMRAFRGETVGDCMRRIVREAFAREQNHRKGATQ